MIIGSYHVVVTGFVRVFGSDELEAMGPNNPCATSEPEPDQGRDCTGTWNPGGLPLQVVPRWRSEAVRRRPRPASFCKEKVNFTSSRDRAQKGRHLGVLRYAGPRGDSERRDAGGFTWSVLVVICSSLGGIVVGLVVLVFCR